MNGLSSFRYLIWFSPLFLRSVSSDAVHQDHADRTPDLVLNLPVKSDSPPYRSAHSSDDGHSLILTDNSPDATVAEQFARSNQGTMKKGEVRSSPHKPQTAEPLRKAPPTSPSLNNFSLGSYAEQPHKVFPKYDVSSAYSSSSSDPSASIDELLESLKAVASPSVVTGGGGGADSGRPAVAPKPQLKSKPVGAVVRKPAAVVVVTSAKNTSDVLRTVRDSASKPTSC